MTTYDDPFGPRDYADFDAIEDRDALADLVLEPCDYCGGELRALGAFGEDVLIECGSCRTRELIERERDEDATVWDDEEEEEEEEEAPA